MNVDVDIYLGKLIGFFRNNPDELLKLIPEDKEKEFFSKIKEAAIENHKNGDELELTKNQLINICVDINKNKTTISKDFYQDTKFGRIYLN